MTTKENGDPMPAVSVEFPGINKAKMRTGNFGITAVDSQYWEAVYKKYKDHPPIKNGTLFMAKDRVEGDAQARAKSSLKTGLEGLNKSNPTRGIQADENQNKLAESVAAAERARTAHEYNEAVGKYKAGDSMKKAEIVAILRECKIPFDPAARAKDLEELLKGQPSESIQEINPNFAGTDDEEEEG